MIGSNIVGYYSSPDESRPTYDPKETFGYRLCPYCLTSCKENENTKTTSLLAEDGSKSFFFSYHVSCKDKATADDVEDLEIKILKEI